MALSFGLLVLEFDFWLARRRSYGEAVIWRRFSLRSLGHALLCMSLASVLIFLVIKIAIEPILVHQVVLTIWSLLNDHTRFNELSHALQVDLGVLLRLKAAGRKLREANSSLDFYRFRLEEDRLLRVLDN